MLTEEQRAARKNGLGGSDAAVLMGLSSFTTPLELYYEKTGLRESEVKESAPMYWGNRLEAVVVEEFSERNGLDVTFPDMKFDDDHPFLFANVDGYIESENAILEVKTASAFTAANWGESGSDEIPMAYLLQVAHYCRIYKADKAYIALLLGGNDYREYTYIRNEELEDTLLKAEIEFWNENVLKEIEPEATTIADMKLKYGVSQDKIISVDGVVNENIAAYANLKLESKKLDASMLEHQLEIMNYMKECEVLVCGNDRQMVTWKTNKRGSRVFSLKI